MITQEILKLEEILDSIVAEEVDKIKESVEEYIRKNSSKGISQMIGRKYGYLWQRLVMKTLEYSKMVELRERVLYKEYVETWIENNIDNRMTKCCEDSSRSIIYKFLSENTGTDKQDLCDLTFITNHNNYAVDTKFRFISNDSNTVREIADSARHLKLMGYIPILLIRRERSESLASPLKRFEKEGWNLKCGQDASNFILKETGFDLGRWIDENIDIWGELVEFQEKLEKFRFGEDDWQF